MKIYKFIITLVSALAIASLAACSSDGGSTGTTGTGGTVVGAVAGFGSIIMSNGVEYDTDDISTCEVDDSNVAGICEDSLDVGMKISMQVDANRSVSSLHYDDDLEGPVTDVNGTDGNYTFKVFGVDVVTATPGTQWQDFTTNPPQSSELDGAIVEVSGEWQGTSLIASYVEKQSSNDLTFEVEGTVQTVNGAMFTLALRNGTIIDVDASGANLIPQAGDYVEVEGTYDGVIFTAIRIELEDEDDFDDDGEAEITGTLLQDTNSTTGYSIGSTSVDISNAPSCNSLVGSIVEAEGSYDQGTGVLLVEECEHEDNELEMKCLVSKITVDVSLPKVGTIECSFPGTTGGPLPVEFRDSPELAAFSDDDSTDHFDLTDVSAGDCVEIKASTDTSGVLVAGLLELEDVGSGCDSYELAGPVEASSASAITVLGITYTVDSNTSYPEGTPVAGDSVEINDTDGDGIADSIETDDSTDEDSVDDD